MRFVLFAALGGVVALASGCGGGSAPAVTVTQAAPTVTVAPSPVVVTPTPEEETPSAEPVEAPPETFTMPKLVGKNLQLAQDILQKEGSYLMDQQDAAGLDRIQVMDSNWKVCTQKPKAGKKVSVEVMVVLASVKLDESCP